MNTHGKSTTMDTPVVMKAAPARPASGGLRRVFTAYAGTVSALRRAIGPLLDLYVRLWLAQGFLVSGLLKVSDWDNALALARYEYPVAWMDPVTAAYLGAATELIAPVLLAMGLMTRVAAVPLALLALVIQFNYQALDAHLLWAALLLGYVVRGAGPLSFDRLLAPGLADSALPLAGAAVRAAAWVTRLVAPVYWLLLRLWLAAGLLVAGGYLDGTALPWLPVTTLAPFAGGFGLILAVLLLAGLALRPVVLAVILLYLGLAMTGPANPDTIHLFLLLLAGLGLAGAGTYSLDQRLLHRMQRTYPELEGKLPGRFEDLPQVVIIGAGFGGLACAHALRHAPVGVTLIDRHNYHLFQPLLYQVATTALAAGDIAMPIRSLLREQTNARVLLGEVTGVDTAQREVRLGARQIPYDYLVLATGATHSYFGRDEWAAFAPGLKRIEDASDMRSRLLLAFEQAEAAQDEVERAALLTFLVVGAGPTGVELAGAIAELARYGMEKEFRHVDPARARVMLVQSGPRILPAFPQSLSARAAAALGKLGVEILTDSRVEAIDADGVRIGGKRIVARNVFWAAGVVASPAAQWLAAGHDGSGRIKVAPDLGVPGHTGVFAIGDTALSTAWNGQPVPGLGPAAKQGGQYVARVIRARVAGRAAPRPFRYRHLGSLATIGRKAAVADFGVVRLSGALAWWLWGLVHVYFLAGMRNRISVMLDWAWAYFTFRSSTRLITRPSSPEPVPGQMAAE
jgi:NADH dehydrogenase/putative oxidoreductase